MKIIFFIPSLDSGGAERVIVTLADELANHHKIIIATRINKKKDFYKVNKVIKRVNLNNFHKKPTNLIYRFIEIVMTIFQIYKLINKEKPDVVVSFLTNLNILSIIGAIIAKTPIIVSERNNFSKNKIGIFKNFLRIFFYPLASFVVFQTRKACMQFYGLSKKKKKIIPNPIAVEINKKAIPKKEKIIIAMGSLTLQKRFDILIDSVLPIKNHLKKKNWKVEIYGEGELKSYLEKKIVNHGLQKIISLKGKTSKPFDKMKKSSIFLLTSDYEGFPNVLLESMACGCVPISVNCDFGPNEIIKNNFNGILIDKNISLISKELYKLTSLDNRFKKMKLNAQKIVYRYDVKKISKKWEKLFKLIQN